VDEHVLVVSKQWSVVSALRQIKGVLACAQLTTVY
jgi:hypothetical protein